MTYSCTIWIPCNDTQWKKLQSLQRPANFIIKSTVTSIGSCLNHDICMLVKRCLQNEFNLATFNNYFEIFYQKMNTRNNNHSITFPRVKHELARQGFFFAAAFFTTPCHWNCSKLLMFCCLRGDWKSTSNRVFAWVAFFAPFWLSLLWFYLFYDSNEYRLAPDYFHFCFGSAGSYLRFLFLS